jgi:hypothetical protein
MTTKIRASALPSWFDCPRRSAARLFPREINGADYELRHTLPSAGAAIGTAVHLAAAKMLQNKIDTGDLLPVDDAAGQAIESFDAEAREGMEWDASSPTPNAAHAQIKRMASVYSAHAANLNPKFIELELLADTGDDVTLSGHIDVLEWDGTLRDTKTGGVERPYQSQLGGYSLLMRANGEPVNALKIDWLKRARVSSVQPELKIKDFNIQTCEVAAFRTIKAIKTQLKHFRETGDPWAFPANPMSMMCSAKYCPCHGTKFCDMATPPAIDGEQIKRG